jgi:hypothetical protein
MGNPLTAGSVVIKIKEKHEPKHGRGAAKRLRAKLGLPTPIIQPR